MKQLITGLLVVLALASGTAKAGFSVDPSIGGPTVIEAGQTATFDFWVDYTPFDLSIFTFSPPEWADHTLGTATFGIEATVRDSENNPTALSTYTYINALSGTYYSNPNPDSTQPFSAHLYLPPLTFDTAGSYSVEFSARYYQTIIRMPSAICLASPECVYHLAEAIGDQYNYVEEFPVGQVELTVTPVPEPETYAMLIAGLGIVSALARRRRLKN